MIPFVFEQGILALACFLFLAAMLSDLEGRQIPNSIPAALLTLFVLYVVLVPERNMLEVWTHILMASLLLAAGFLVYSTGAFGGGDGKLMATAGLWVGPAGFSQFLLTTGAFSLILAAVALLPHPATRKLRSNLPFAVAIGTPSVLILSHKAFPDWFRMPVDYFA